MDIEGDRVTAVRYERKGQVRTVSGDEVALCAGTYHSPQILMLSGIGPPAELERLGVPVVHALNGIGEGHQDHAVVFLQFEGAKPHIEDWITTAIMLNLKSDPDLEYSNFEAIIRQPTQMEGLGQVNTISVHLIEQRSRGRIYLKSTDPAELPGIDPRLLEDPADIDAMVTVMRLIDELWVADSDTR